MFLVPLPVIATNQSSTSPGRESWFGANATDGGNCAETLDESSPWWQAELDDIYHVKFIAIFVDQLQGNVEDHVFNILFSLCGICESSPNLIIGDL